MDSGSLRRAPHHLSTDAAHSTAVHLVSDQVQHMVS
jgi:hypothetical protein